ncbi:GTPase IMAP family member 4-like [Conger conger]|uniref:GTPase IMAP family member 4-like n=1 Tax=Conger conger TaxID=82655 RepID=UPI002A5A706B|nr:GTPase IMAP family member 4-like [Conger conger]
MGNSNSRVAGYSRMPEGVPLTVVLLGKHRAGKSSVGNAILGRTAFRICRTFTKGSVQEQGNVDDRVVTVVHTPGWRGLADTTSEKKKRQMRTSIYRGPDGLLGFVFVVSIDSTLTREDREVAKKHMQLISSSVWQHTVLVLTSHRRRERDIEKHTDLQWFLRMCGNRYVVFDKDKDKEQVTNLLTKLVNVAMRYNATENCFASVGHAQSRCCEMRTVAENGLEQENTELPEATTSDGRRSTMTQENHCGHRGQDNQTKTTKSAETGELNRDQCSIKGSQ